MDGECLAELRKNKGMTQKELADALSVSLNSVSLYERNLSTPDDDTKIRIAKMFNVSLDYLMGVTKIEHPMAVSEPKFIYIKHLPSKADQELVTFLEYLKNKYDLE